jgi:hypothetical protein
VKYLLLNAELSNAMVYLLCHNGIPRFSNDTLFGKKRCAGAAM